MCVNHCFAVRNNSDTVTQYREKEDDLILETVFEQKRKSSVLLPELCMSSRLGIPSQCVTLRFPQDGVV